MIPVVRLEIEGMRHALQVALADHVVRLDSDIQQAIANFCDDSKLQTLIDEQVNIHMRLAVESAVRDFFSYGQGRTVIKEQVFRHLEEQFGERK